MSSKKTRKPEPALKTEAEVRLEAQRRLKAQQDKLCGQYSKGGISIDALRITSRIARPMGEDRRGFFYRVCMVEEFLKKDRALHCKILDSLLEYETVSTEVLLGMAEEYAGLIKAKGSVQTKDVLRLSEGKAPKS